jgi:bacterioferritin (cytochrome b1)
MFHSHLPGLSPTARELIPELREHQGAFGTLLHQYLKQSSLATDAQRFALRTMLEHHSLQTYHHLKQVGVCITDLGGVPLGSMLELVNMSPLEPEPENTEGWGQMLGHDLRLETQHDALLGMTEETARARTQPYLARALVRLRGVGAARRKRLLVALAKLEEKP